MIAAAKKFAFLFFCALLLDLPSSPARADVFRGGEITLVTADALAGADGTDATRPGARGSATSERHAYVLRARLPVGAALRDGVIWPDDCRQVDVRQTPVEDELLITYRIECSRPLPGDTAIRAPWPVDGARYVLRLGERTAQRVVRPGADGLLTLPLAGSGAEAPPPWQQVAARYVWQGMLHIWLGWDHLALVLCLCLMVRGRALLGLITTFTAGHSLSLGLAFFEVIAIAIPPVEALIALSIAWLAREALNTPEPVPQARGRDYAVVGVFGLVHGLGFASALGELGVGAGERTVALAAFNVGVEAGQVAIVVVLLALRAVLERWPRPREALRAGALYAAGGVGTFWLLERVAGF